MLEKNTAMEERVEDNSIGSKNSDIAQDLLAQVKLFIRMIAEAIIDFYKIKLGIFDLKKDLITVLSTNLIMSEEVYFVMFNMLSQVQEKKLQKLKKVMNSVETQEKYFSFDALKIERQLQFDKEHWKDFEEEAGEQGEEDDYSVFQFKQNCLSVPYCRVLDSILDIIKIESPIVKLEQIYRSCTR